MAGRLQDAVAVVNDVEPAKVNSTVGEARAVLERLVAEALNYIFRNHGRPEIAE